MSSKFKPVWEMTGSVRFHKIGKVQFWLTAANRIFLLVGGAPIFPTLYCSDKIQYDDQHYVAPPAVEEFLRQALSTQQQIRATWPAPEEDAVAYDFN